MAKTLILYFSATGTTQAVAKEIAQKLEADLYQIQPQKAYSKKDLDWNNPHSRANQEQENPNSRPAFSGQLPDISSYEQVIIGHPIWWSRPPRIIETVLEDLKLKDKKVATFATSGGSSYDKSQAVFEKTLGVKLPAGRVLSTSHSVDNWLAQIAFKD